MNRRGGGLPIEQFIQALTSQLDRAQSAMALKASAGLPLTFAVKDISIDLRAHVEVEGSAVRIVPAGPGDGDASTLHIALTTITRPMIEENTLQLSAEPDEPSLKDVLGDEVSEEEQRRLEWAGVHTVSQLRELQRRSSEDAIVRVAQLPVERLRAALTRASQPFVSHVAPDLPRNGGRPLDEPPLLRIRGHNLMQEQTPQVRIQGEQIPVLKATAKELVIAPLAHQLGGTLEVEIAPGLVSATEFDLTPLNRPAKREAAAPPSEPAAPADEGGEP
ncbi:MAG TPA: hypothetical protein VJ866_16055 [Pyrinomonadaceae bacterium]|nr:hypothetical protein [Pyrinomonadaceae bacterium]